MFILDSLDALMATAETVWEDDKNIVKKGEDDAPRELLWFSSNSFSTEYQWNLYICPELLSR